MRVYAEVPKHFLYSNTRGDFTIGRGEICVDGSLEYFAGEYVVTKTSFGGGGSTGYPGGNYPDGHRVYCESTTKPARKIDFYQSGCFTCMLPDIKPIGRAELKWVIKEAN